MENDLRKWMRLVEDVWLHGTDASFDGFVIPEKGKNGDMFGPAVYVTNSPDYADKFGNTILKVEVSHDLKIIDEKDAPRAYGHHMKRWALAHGYGAVRRNVGGGTIELAIYDLRKVKIVRDQ